MSGRRSSSSSPERDLFGITAELVPDRENKHPSTAPLDFDGLLPTPILLHEDLKEGCGGQLWPAGMVLSKYMLQYHKNLQNERIVEIGAGGGLVGLAVAKGCSLSNDSRHKLVISDQIPMLALMQKNIAMNELEDKVEAVVYDWGTPAPESILQPPTATSSQQREPTIVLAADCVYFEPAFPLLLETLSDIIGPETKCYFCFKKRRKADMRFIRDMQKRFDTEYVEYDEKELDQRQVSPRASSIGTVHPPGARGLHAGPPRHTAPQLHHGATDLVAQRGLAPRRRGRRGVVCPAPATAAEAVAARAPRRRGCAVAAGHGGVAVGGAPAEARHQARGARGVVWGCGFGRVGCGRYGGAVGVA